MRVVPLVVALVLGGAVPAAAQSVCAECQPLARQLDATRKDLAEAEARFKSLQGLLAELEESQTQVALETIRQRTPVLEALRVQIAALTQAVQAFEAKLNDCQRGCEKPRQPPGTDPAGTNFVDENIPRAACSACQPIVERILDLQKRRRFARNRLNSIDDTIAASSTRTGPAAGQALLVLVKDRATAVARIQDLTAEIAKAMGELTDCNLKCGNAPGGGTTLVTPQTGQTTSRDVTPQTTCPECEDAARRLSEAEGRKKLVEEELQDFEQDQQQQTEQQQSRQKALAELRANGQGSSDEAFQLEKDIRSHEQEQAIREQGLGDDPYPKELQQRLSALEKEMSELKQKLEDCEKECKPKKTSQLFRGPWPYAAGGLVGVAALRGGDSGPSVTTTGTTVVPPAAAVNPTPAPVPVLDAIDLLMGLYLIQTCVCTFNPADQDAFIRLCQSLRQFRLTRTGLNTGRLDGDSPLLTSDFILDANSQTINGSAMGGPVPFNYSGDFRGGEPPAQGTLTLLLDFRTADTTTRYRVTAVKQ